MVRIVSEKEFCWDKPDFLIHTSTQEVSNPSLQDIEIGPLKLNCSAGQDNHTDTFLINEIISTSPKQKINCLDLGCAGGQLIVDLSKRDETDICIGLDGSCGVYKHQNWHLQENKNILKHADLTEPFSIEGLADQKRVKFDYITCFEVIEHFDLSELDTFFKNVSRHLSSSGVFFGSIALFSDTRDSDGYHQDHPLYNKNDPNQYVLHKTVFENPSQWDEILKKYFYIINYPFSVKLRNHSNSYYFACTKKD